MNLDFGLHINPIWTHTHPYTNSAPSVIHISMDNRALVGGLEIAIPCIYGPLAYFFKQSVLHAAPEVVRAVYSSEHPQCYRAMGFSTTVW